MKNIFILVAVFLLSIPVTAAVSKESQRKFSDMLNQVGLRNYWAKIVLFGLKILVACQKWICRRSEIPFVVITKVFFVVTFWQNINAPSGQIVKVTCRN